MTEQNTASHPPSPEQLRVGLPYEDRHYEADVDRYNQGLSLVELFEALPEDEKRAVHNRSLQLYYGAEMGDVEAIAFAMRERYPAEEDTPE